MLPCTCSDEMKGGELLDSALKRPVLRNVYRRISFGEEGERKN